MALRKFKTKEGAVHWQIDYYAPDGKRVRQVFELKKDAEGELEKRKTLIRENPKRYLELSKHREYLFEELLCRYEATYSNQTSWRTGKRFFIIPWLEHFEGKLLSRITPYDLETYRNKRKATPRSNNGKERTDATVNRDLSGLRHMFNKGMEWGMMKQSPFSQVKKLFYKENNKRLRYLTEKEIDRLLEVSDQFPGYLKWIVITAINTGMRRQELLNLKFDQINDGFIYLTETKTNEARQIPINDDLKVLFEEISEGRKQRNLISPYVFCDSTGKPFKDVKASFNAALRKANIRDFTFHDLRHTFASHYLMRGGSLKNLQQILGHKDIKMTMRYAHLSREFQKEEIRVMNGLTGGHSQILVKSGSLGQVVGRLTTGNSLVGRRGLELRTY